MSKAKQPLVEVGRLAFRVEGKNWNCYWAPQQHSMDGAVFIGTLTMRFAQIPALKAAFMDLMRAAFDTVAKERFGTASEWRDPRPAPESERSGRA